MKTLSFLVLFLIAGTAWAQSPKKWFLEGGAHLSADAELALVAPALSLGAAFKATEHLYLTSSYTFFYARASGYETFRTHTLDALVQYQFQNIFHPSKGFYLGLGAARQFRHQTPEEMQVQNTRYWTGVFNLGYRFPIQLGQTERSLAVDLKTFGPYAETNYTEALTQLMLGIKLRF
jgi:hypothetical protein